MSCVIFRPKTKKYIAGRHRWTKNREAALQFSKRRKAENYMKNNFRYDFPDVPSSEIEILDAKAKKTYVPKSRGYTVETAAAALNSLRSTVADAAGQARVCAALEAYYDSELRNADLELNDLLHRVEGPVEDAETGYWLYQQIRDARMRRRSAKDALSLMKVLTGVLETQMDADEALREWDKAQAARVYCPRIRPELFEDRP